MLTYHPEMAKSRQPDVIDAGDLPLSIRADSDSPAYVQIGQQLRALIESSTIRVGAKLPSSRALASVLGVNRNTIVAAFEWLANAGVVEAHGRAGTVVSDLSSYAAQPKAERVSAKRQPPERAVARGSAGLIDFRLGSADPTPLPVEVWRRACREAGRHLPRADYGDPRGEEALRRQIVLYVGRTRGLRVESEQVLITAGAGQAIERIADVALQQGDFAALEEPGYPRAAHAFSRSGATVLPVDVDEEGIDVAQLLALKRVPKVVHVTPSHQYPLGARLSAVRREQLMTWAHQKRVLIIENDYDGEFRYGSAPLPALAAMANLADVAYVGTFSKVLTPAIRLGFLVAKTDLVDVVARVVAESRDPVSIITQRIVCWLIASGELDRHLRRTRRQYAARRAVALQSLAGIRGVESVSGESAGLHVVIRLSEGLSQNALMLRLAEDDVKIDRAADFRMQRAADPRLLVAYGHLREDKIQEGAMRLAAAIAAIARSPAR